MKINRLLPLALVMVLACSTGAQARLGESEDAIIQRFGKSALKQRFDWCEKDYFNVNGFSIVVTLLKGQSMGESYRISTGTLVTCKSSNF